MKWPHSCLNNPVNYFMLFVTIIYNMHKIQHSLPNPCKPGLILSMISHLLLFNILTKFILFQFPFHFK